MAELVAAFAYCRVSGLTQAGEDKDGLPRQLAACERYAAANGLKIVRVFSDEGVSGTTDLEQRPALFELDRELMSGAVSHVIIENMSRLARDLIVGESILRDWVNKKVTVHSTQEPDLCSNEPGRKMIRQILAAVAEWERAVTTARMRAGKIRAKAQGKSIGGMRPYGSDEREKRIIRAIVELKREGVSALQLSEMLYQEGARTRKGTRISPMQVIRIWKRYGSVLPPLERPEPTSQEEITT